MRSTIRLATIGGLSALGALAGAAGIASVAVAASQAPVTEEMRIDAADFTGVTLEGAMNVIIEQGAETEVVARGPKPALADLDPVVEKGVLRLKEKKGFVRNRLREGRQPVTITIRMPGLRSFSLAGAGDVTFRQLRAETLDLKVAGSGDITASGTCKALNISLAGAGNIDAKDFKCAAVAVKVAGSGDISTYASKDFSARIMGAGDITVYGNPVNRSRSVLGAGDIKYVTSR